MKNGSCSYCGKINKNKHKVGHRYYCSDDCRLKDFELKKKERIAMYERQKRAVSPSFFISIPEL